MLDAVNDATVNRYECIYCVPGILDATFYSTTIDCYLL